MLAKYDMGGPAVLLLETMKPLIWIGGGIARIALSPYMMLFWKDGYRLIDTFERRSNIEKLIKMIEDEHEKSREAEKKKKSATSHTDKDEAESPKKGWKRYLPF